MTVRAKWWAVALAVATMAAPVRAQEPRPPLERGLILGSVEAAMRVPVERMENFSLVVDLSDRMLYVMSGDSVARRFPVSVGSEGYGTPPGQYRIRRLDWNPTWTPPASPWARG
ncbi:MAG TPA: L,D-transpeptidase, partial [Longimicrobium sp.]|nr:L,D-transpeptidase [Longimicrobium sp.]